jgi:predicted component of type VI protein secretion system
VTHRSKDDAQRHYPKRRDGATNHWAAVVNHVAEFDNKMKNKAQVEAKQNQHSLALTLNEQMNTRKKAKENLKKKEKDLERSCLSYGMSVCRDEKALAKEK